MVAVGSEIDQRLRRDVRLNAFVADALAIEQEEAREAGALGYMARLLVQVTIPHARQAGTEFKRSNGETTVRVLSPSEVGLPYGHYPRLLLAWITTEAVRSQNPMLELGDSLSAFIIDLGLIPSGGRWGTVPRLRDHMRRLFASTVSWTYSGAGAWVDGGVRPVKTAQLWWDPKSPAQAALWKSSLTLTREFYEEIVNRPVPIDMRVLKALARERSPLAIDIYTWLTYRMSYLRKESVVPWELLQLQFGCDYTEAHRFKAKFVERLKLVKTLYPGANVDVQKNGLFLRPSLTHVLPDRLRD
jgi:hypothetical protein